jgi:hypothetical protein
MRHAPYLAERTGLALAGARAGLKGCVGGPPLGIHGFQWFVHRRERGVKVPKVGIKRFTLGPAEHSRSAC